MACGDLCQARLLSSTCSSPFLPRSWREAEVPDWTREPLRDEATVVAQQTCGSGLAAGARQSDIRFRRPVLHAVTWGHGHHDRHTKRINTPPYLAETVHAEPSRAPTPAPLQVSLLPARPGPPRAGARAIRCPPPRRQHGSGGSKLQAQSAVGTPTAPAHNLHCTCDGEESMHAVKIPPRWHTTTRTGTGATTRAAPRSAKAAGQCKTRCRSRLRRRLRPASFVRAKSLSPPHPLSPPPPPARLHFIVSLKTCG